MSVKFNKNGIVSSDSFYGSEAMNLAYRADETYYNNTVLTYIPTTANNSCMGGFYINVDDFTETTKFKILVDVKWSGFDTSNTSGTFDIYWQGAVWERGSSGWTWNHYNYCGSSLNAWKNLKSLVLSADSGSYRYETSFLLEESWLTSCSKLELGIRSNYSNGTGTISISNIKVMPEKYYTIPCSVNTSNSVCKIGKDYIVTNDFIEL